ncbi:hypothetical protein GLAREA_07885 [Glarea lozoyensis ATCC 20868]|uniref:Copper acquisition factor BIM1-like domain-containing protein n=1 Tax=Glarea lozoyensis (strain ATCC 20868 / MF5171) TaxID=1116229 RepID=S3DL29_GLAL2|nr:uncharacterized protein GLAREA_07885 [Glarea lozoyensis ATCC 20868]EPE32751.1 hypothetical protein GLAREA_07885 [Glarea lozoyensis ATCC 20868]
MLFQPLSLLAVMTVSSVAAADFTPHAAGAEGSVMGPVQFLWPTDRPWSADADNTAPCGSNSGVTNRTQFPLDPTAQGSFNEQIVHNITEVNPGHQCYRVPSTPDNISAGANATIQLEYWSTYENEPIQSFYACADVTLIEASTFVGTIPCFNVTSTDFVAPSTTPSTATPPDSSVAPTLYVSASSSRSLSEGAIAGIAVGSVVGGLALIAIVAFVLLRRRKTNRNAQAADEFPAMEKKERAASLASEETQVQK